MNELHLFAGAGGGILGGMLLGHRTVCAVEIEPYCRKVLLQRQRDGILPWFPIWDDVRTFDGKPWRGIADVVCGGFPCQDISAAGNGKGITGERSGLWFEMARIIDEIRPAYVFVENSPMLLVRGIDRVLGQLATMGYDAKWGVFSAGDVGALHERERLWLLAQSNKERLLPDLQKNNGMEGTRKRPAFRSEDWFFPEMAQAMRRTVDGKWQDYPDATRDVDDVAHRLDRIKATGNGQVPAVVACAWRTLMDT